MSFAYLSQSPSFHPQKALSLLAHQNVYLVTVLFNSTARSSTSSGWRMDTRTLLTVECLSLWRAHCTVIVVAVTLAISNPSTGRGPGRMREGKRRRWLRLTPLDRDTLTRSSWVSAAPLEASFPAQKFPTEEKCQSGRLTGPVKQLPPSLGALAPSNIPESSCLRQRNFHSIG